MGITEFIIHYATLIIDQTGYLGIGFLMILESMIAPVPSEAVMPFAGFLWFEGKMNPWIIIIVSTIGSIIGSLLSYWIGAYGGRPFIKKFGKYLLLNEHHLDMTERFFSRFGEKAIFISRFVPVVRHLISLPAGVGRMRMDKFIVYTIVGAGLWNAFLAYLGYKLGENWERIGSWTHILDIILVVALVGVIGYFLYKQIKSRNTQPPQSL